MAVMFSPLVDATSKQRYAEGNLMPKFALIDAHLAHNDHALAARFSVTDADLYDVLRCPPRVQLDVSGYASLQAFMARMERRPSLGASLQAEGLAAR